MLVPLALVLGCLFAGLALRRCGVRCSSFSGRLFLVGTGLLYLLSSGAVKNGLVYLLESRYPVPEVAQIETVDALVVLGGGVLPARGLRPKAVPSGFTYSRTVHAVDVLKQTSIPYLVLCGERAAPMMRDLAVDMGVPAERIVVEAHSYNTRAHPVELKKLPELQHVRKVGVVTSALHMPRAVAEFEKHYSYVVPVPCDFIFEKWGWSWGMLIPSSGALYHNSMFFHEILGLLWYKVLDWNGI